MSVHFLPNSEAKFILSGFDRNGYEADIKTPGEVDGVVTLKNWRELLGRALVTTEESDFPKGTQSVIMRISGGPLFSSQPRSRIIEEVNKYSEGRLTLG